MGTPMMEIRRARTPEDFEGMRLVRNSCREFMTNDTHEISPEEQVRWSQSFHDLLVFPYICRLVGNREVIGYGLVARAHVGADWWLTGGLLPSHRGQGLGRELFLELLAKTPRPCWLQVRESNAPACKLYESIGFIYQTNAHRGAGAGVLAMVAE